MILLLNTSILSIDLVIQHFHLLITNHSLLSSTPTPPLSSLSSTASRMDIPWLPNIIILLFCLVSFNNPDIKNTLYNKLFKLKYTPSQSSQSQSQSSTSLIYVYIISILHSLSIYLTPALHLSFPHLSVSSLFFLSSFLSPLLISSSSLFFLFLLFIFFSMHLRASLHPPPFYPSSSPPRRLDVAR